LGPLESSMISNTFQVAAPSEIKTKIEGSAASLESSMITRISHKVALSEGKRKSRSGGRRRTEGSSLEKSPAESSRITVAFIGTYYWSYETKSGSREQRSVVRSEVENCPRESSIITGTFDNPTPSETKKRNPPRSVPLWHSHLVLMNYHTKLIWIVQIRTIVRFLKNYPNNLQ
jgi:hypothetical protein